MAKKLGDRLLLNVYACLYIQELSKASKTHDTAGVHFYGQYVTYFLQNKSK